MVHKRGRPADPTYRDTGTEPDIDVEVRPTKRAKQARKKEKDDQTLYIQAKPSKTAERKTRSKIEAAKEKAKEKAEATRHQVVLRMKSEVELADVVSAAILKEAEEAAEAVLEARYNAVKTWEICSNFDQQRAGIRKSQKSADIQALRATEKATRAEFNWLKQIAAENEDQQDELLHKLTELSHSEYDLLEAGFPRPGRPGFARATARDPKEPKKGAVALDCEFVQDAQGQSMLAQLVVIDVLTGKVLVDQLVRSPRPIANYATPFSGLTKNPYKQYSRLKRVLPDVTAAQNALFEHIDAETIIIGWSVHNDFEKPELCQERVVDPQLLLRRTVENKYGSEFGARLGRLWKLKDIMAELLGRFVQLSENGHDCMEDTFAARELMIWWLRESNAKPVRRWVRKMARDRSAYLDSTCWLDELERQNRFTPASEDSEANLEEAEPIPVLEES
ncbi:hypothetical protein BDW74DRAFT_181431 [Aspergillus multicolor]|uniref:uncharacterized protein n=1 Tax=Aspergillus multicolor TaxID=41759 RepID=UPI003CCC9FF8